VNALLQCALMLSTNYPLAVVRMHAYATQAEAAQTKLRTSQAAALQRIGNLEAALTGESKALREAVERLKEGLVAAGRALKEGDSRYSSRLRCQ
jgi:hypothetical protein